MEKKFKIYVRAIINNNEGSILLLRKKNDQKYGAGNFLIPGGTVEFGEDIEETLYREIKEEVNLEIKSIKLFETRKMIIKNEHWLGIYYIVKVNNIDDLKNMEPDKHVFCDFLNIKNISNFFHKDLLLKYLDKNYNRKFHIENIYSTKLKHTMGKSIEKYVDIKIHHFLKEKEYKNIKVIGQYDRENSVISNYEKNDKLFNWKRPTALKEGDTITIKCFPGDDYVKHYYYLINTYLKLNNIKGIFTSYELPSKKLKENIFNNYDFSDFTNSDYIILGHIDKIDFFENIEYKSINDFKYKVGKIGKNKVVLLGIEFSIWADIGFYLIKTLSKYNIKNIIYVGKVGTMNKKIIPNSFLATGNNSFLNGKNIVWNNLFSNIKGNNIIKGKHYTSKSIILEDKNWLEENINYDFVDPEIGWFAKSANKNKIGFSYLHIISNNLNENKYKEDLSNERKTEIIDKRIKLFNDIKKYLLQIIK